MFDILKKKITGFIDSLTKKEEKKEEKLPAPPTEPEKRIIEEEIKAEPKAEVKHREIKKAPKPESVAQKIPEKKIQVPKIAETKAPEKELPKVPEQKKAAEVKIDLFKQLKSVFTGEVEIAEGDVLDLLENLELEMLESDVALEAADEIKKRLEQKLIGVKVPKGELNIRIKAVIKETLVEIMESERSFDILEKVKNTEKPVKIMFLGINGAGKTTSIAKIAKMLMDNNYKVILAASDTFRAAAIEQLQIHADRLGVKLIKREYGSDPTAVAYDAMNHAKANGIDVVLIDTAGRQETNMNLINELKKMVRVIQPQLKIYIGESIAGNSVMQQVGEFDKEIGVDGVILTKLDCDPKGGVVLSITKMTGLPILYVGTGQEYSAIEKFDAKKIGDKILE